MSFSFTLGSALGLIVFAAILSFFSETSKCQSTKLVLKASSVSALCFGLVILLLFFIGALFFVEEAPVTEQHLVGEYTLVDLDKREDAETYLEIDNNMIHKFAYYGGDGIVQESINTNERKDFIVRLFLVNLKEQVDEPSVAIYECIVTTRSHYLFMYGEETKKEMRYSFTIPNGTMKETNS